MAEASAPASPPVAPAAAGPLPVIDVGPLVRGDADAAEVARVAAALRDACVEWGFFYITGHGLEKQVRSFCSQGPLPHTSETSEPKQCGPPAPARSRQRCAVTRPRTPPTDAAPNSRAGDLRKQQTNPGRSPT
jgi:hypothetical protein